MKIETTRHHMISVSPGFNEHGMLTAIFISDDLNENTHSLSLSGVCLNVGGKLHHLYEFAIYELGVAKEMTCSLGMYKLAEGCDDQVELVFDPSRVGCGYKAIENWVNEMIRTTGSESLLKVINTIVQSERTPHQRKIEALANVLGHSNGIWGYTEGSLVADYFIDDAKFDPYNDPKITWQLIAKRKIHIEHAADRYILTRNDLQGCRKEILYVNTAAIASTVAEMSIPDSDVWPAHR